MPLLVALRWVACCHCMLFYHESLLTKQDRLKTLICANVYASVAVHFDYISISEAEWLP